MAQGTISDDMISWATATLIRLTDDDILRHEDEFQQLVTRITRVTACPSQTAETILEIARANLRSLMEFFREDHTKTILQFRYTAGSDPRTVVLSVRDTSKKCLRNLLLRLLAYRYLALGHRQLESDEGIDGPSRKRSRPKRHGKGQLMLRSKGLNTNYQAVDGLKRGKKALTIEDSLGLPEVSLVLLHSLSKLHHLHSSEVARVGEIFRNDEYRELGDACRSLNARRLLSEYQSLYNHHVGRSTERQACA
ncbi:hypothetical protein IFM51744_09073 [Aspergillus udagawae]|nr:hypothetical protein IFM51744_09073 [Aspergillus udagawae]